VLARELGYAGKSLPESDAGESDAADAENRLIADRNISTALSQLDQSPGRRLSPEWRTLRAAVTALAI